jgi:serine/threonine protein kinase
MELKPGAKLGPYEIVSPIGKGGMGEVWKARDPRLGRDVAIKISAQQFTDRFEREARAIASLNHPNIFTLHDVGPNYLVMELVEGPTLTERIAQGRSPWKKRSPSPGRSPMPSKPPTKRASSTAISSPPTSKFAPMAR